MKSLEMLCLILVGFTLVQAQVEEPQVPITPESLQSEPSTTSVYDRLAERMNKLGDRSNARMNRVGAKMSEASAKIQEKWSELNRQRTATQQEIMQEARSGGSNIYKGASEMASELGSSLFSVAATSAVGAFRLGHEISQAGQPEDATQELINLLEEE